METKKFRMQWEWNGERAGIDIAIDPGMLYSHSRLVAEAIAFKVEAELKKFFEENPYVG